MTLVKAGDGIVDIRGSLGGVYFHRDKSGLHSSSMPRKVRRRSAAQKLQRDAFVSARVYSADYRIVSFLMYRYMNGLSLAYPPTWKSPVTFLDPVPGWIDEILCFDDDLDTFAFNAAVDHLKPLQLFPFQPYVSNKIRINAAGRIGPNTEDAHFVNIKIRDVATGWHDIHEGDLPERTWLEIEFPEYTVDAAEITSVDSTREFLLYEFDFNTITNPVDGSTHWPVPFDYEIPRL